MYFFTKRFKFFLFLCLVSAGNVVFAQNTLKGIYVVNAASKIPVPDAFAQSEDFTFHASADDNGFISFKGLPASISILNITRIGFEPKKIDIGTLSITGNSATIYVDNKVSSLDEVKVLATANNGVFKTISDLDIHLRPINNSQEVLRMVPGYLLANMQVEENQNRYFFGVLT